jgi:DNA-binding beta-propeller fold protein YncE
VRLRARRFDVVAARRQDVKAAARLFRRAFVGRNGESLQSRNVDGSDELGDENPGFFVGQRARQQRSSRKKSARGVGQLCHAVSIMRVALLLCLAGCGVSLPPGSDWPTRPVPPWAAQPRFAITVNLDDELAFVSTDPYATTLFGTEPVGDIPVELEGPHHLVASPDGLFIYANLSNYVPGTGSGPHGSHGTGTVPGSLLKLDSRNAAKLAEVLVDRSPGDVILNKDGSLAFVSHYDLARLQTQLTTGTAPETGFSAIAVIDTQNMLRLSLLPICPTAHGIGLSPDEQTLYATCALSDELAVVDVSNPSAPMLKQKLPVGPSPGPVGAPVYNPYALTVSPKDGSVWVSDNYAGDVRVYDPVTQAMDPARVYGVGGVAMFGAFMDGGDTYWVPHQGDDKLTRIDVATGAMSTLDLPRDACLNAHALVMAPSGTSGVVVCEGDHRTVLGTAVGVDLVGRVVGSAAPIGLFPDGAAWLPPAKN